MRVTAAKAILERLPAVSRKDNAARVINERDEDENSENLEFREKARSKQGYGVFVDKRI
jgi:hypothetical protein